MRIFRLLHPLDEVYLSPFVDDFHYEMVVILDQEAFVYALVRSPHFFFDGPSGMVYDFYEIVLSLIILQMALTSILK